MSLVNKDSLGPLSIIVHHDQRCQVDNSGQPSSGHLRSMTSQNIISTQDTGSLHQGPAFAVLRCQIAAFK